MFYEDTRQIKYVRQAEILNLHLFHLSDKGKHFMGAFPLLHNKGWY
jgi:hypothetical protein